jgi:hypothetical protein
MLLTGVYFYFLDQPSASEDDPPSDDVLRAAWESLREELIAEHVAAQPGTRPWGWWRFDSPERPARRLMTESDIAYLRRLNRLTGDEESETACLRRLNLLTADEERTLNRDA